MFQVQKRRKSCCPHGHILQSKKTKVKLESFLQRFPGNVKIHVPSSLTCSRCECNIYADYQPTVATCESCNFHLCHTCVANSSSDISFAMSYDDNDDFSTRKRKGRQLYMEESSNQMSCEYEDPNVINLTNRYNNVRPNYALCPRVPYHNYPEPSNYGWRFTGSCESSKTEFFEQEVENGVVLLDFYFMSGTIKTVLNHRVDGQICMFAKGKSLLPDIYRNVLRNPQISDVRYRRRSS